MDPVDKAFDFFKDQPRILQSVLSCDIVTGFNSVGPPTSYDLLSDWADSAEQPAELASQMANVLSKMPQLKTLRLTLPTCPDVHIQRFRSSIQTTDVRLTSVRALIAGSECHFLVDYCPDVETIAAADSPWDHRAGGSLMHLVKAAGKAEHMRHFEMAARWKPELLWAIHAAMPNLQSLALTFDGMSSTLQGLLSALYRFEGLRSLSLAPAPNMGASLYWLLPYYPTFKPRMWTPKWMMEGWTARALFDGCKSLGEV
ncbi:hypothetical protein H2201_005259 [Coniosporium apollinis]|uniref:Uncharacterized protein n=1 Tax=Coniosporium apollinis TaxID=61459 RepID=A0ABQ9NSI6_9PEZI|nr:hypothetical protein H2201_005259 [Coniosporium apollinis]